MVSSCYAVNCTNRYGAKDHEGKMLTFHRFPKKPEIRRLWTAAVRRYDPVTKKLWQPGEHACLCSEHFEPEDFTYDRGHRLIREGAIPTRFNYLTTKMNKIKVQRTKEVNKEVAPEPTISSVLSSNVHDTTSSNVDDTTSSNVDDTTQNKSEDVSKASSYSQWLLQNLFSLRAQDIFCDTVLVVGKRQLKAHSVVLSAGSPFFHSALKFYSKPGLRYLTLPGFNFDVLEIAVRFIYTGKFEVGMKYAKPSHRTELLNSLGQLGLNLEHLEECEIVHHSDAEDVVGSHLKMKSTAGAEVQDISSENPSDEEQSPYPVRDRKTESVVPGKSRIGLNQSSIVSSSLHDVEEIEGGKVYDVGCDVALAPAEGCSNKARTPEDSASVLSGMTNGWVLRSKTGVHLVEVPRELLAEIELENQKKLPDQANREEAPPESLRKSFHSKAKNVRTNRRSGPATAVHRRCFIAKPRPTCNEYTVAAICDDLPIVKQTHDIPLKKEGASKERRCLPAKRSPRCSESSADAVCDDMPIVKEKRIPQKKEKHVCPTCGKEFLGISRYNVHLRVHSGEKPYSCKSCGKAYGINANLTRHMRSHTDDRRYLCDFCGHAFFQKSTLEDHVASIHTKEKKHMCTSCGRFFPTLGCYRAHSKRHNCGSVKYRREYNRLSEEMRQMCQEATVSVDGVSRFVCKICKKDYASKNILAIHLKRHSIAKPFVCNFCTKSFWQRFHLDVHERTHTGEKPFTCNTCGKGFSSHGRLGIHEMLHTDRKPYKCNTCGSSFSVLAYLKVHMRMHSDDRPYECKLCDKKYGNKINLQSHLNRAHDSNATV